MMIKVIAAVAENGVIGKHGTVPWENRDDLVWFQTKTKGSIVVQGHTTLNSIIARNHKPLPGRRNIVLSRHVGSIKIDGVEVWSKFDEVLALAKTRDIWVIGGAQIYTLALPHAAEIHLTIIHALPEGDTHFPAWDTAEWDEIYLTHRREADARNQFDFTHKVFRRKGLLEFSMDQSAIV